MGGERKFVGLMACAFLTGLVSGLLACFHCEAWVVGEHDTDIGTALAVLMSNDSSIGFGTVVGMFTMFVSGSLLVEGYVTKEGWMLGLLTILSLLSAQWTWCMIALVFWLSTWRGVLPFRSQ